MNIPPSEVNQNWGNASSQTTNNGNLQTNFIPKKVTISYDGPLPQNEQDGSE
jgi:hypothetical protein